MKRIPITKAKEIAKQYSYDQIIIIARKVGEGGWVTSYGINKEHCKAAEETANTIKGLENGSLIILSKYGDEEDAQTKYS